MHSSIDRRLSTRSVVDSGADVYVVYAALSAVHEFALSETH